MLPIRFIIILCKLNGMLKKRACGLRSAPRAVLGTLSSPKHWR